MIFVPFVQSVYWIITNRRHINTHTFVKDPFFRGILLVGIFVAPWFYRIASESANLKTSWYFPVDIQLVKSVLGNMFLGYEGTPGGFWGATFIFSCICLGMFLFALRGKTYKRYTSFFFLLATLPLAIIIGISFKKPLFVNRYLIPVTIAEVFLFSFALFEIKHRSGQIVTAGLLLLFVIGFNIWYPSRHAKLDIRSTFMVVNTLKNKDDIILAESPLILFESIYYAKDTRSVFLYNPQEVAFPWYVGGAIVSKSQMIQDLPVYPHKAFLIHQNGTFDVVYRTSAALPSTISKPKPASL
jgi:hypothetical protein